MDLQVKTKMINQTILFSNLLFLRSDIYTSCYTYYTMGNQSQFHRATINLDRYVYTRLRQQGKFGETFSDIVDRLLNKIETEGNNK